MSTGSCLCHKVKYKYDGEPVAKAICHCLSCRKISGGTHTTNILVPEDKISVIEGAAKKYTQTHENGKKLTVNFCGDCGSALYKTHESLPGSVVILAGTLDDPKGLEQAKPDQELWINHRVSWLPRFDWTGRKEEF